MQINQPTFRSLISTNAKHYPFAIDSDSNQQQLPPNLLETLQSIINSRGSTTAIKSKTSSESLEERALRKWKKHKIDDLNRLQEISKNIDIFCSMIENEKRLKALYDIGQLAGEIKFNDRKEHKEEYLRNKYGSIDRSNDSKQRKGGLELPHLNALQHIAAIGLKSSTPQLANTTQISNSISEKEYSSLIPDFELIKKKIHFIAKDDHSAFTAKEINDEFKAIGVAKNIQSFVNKHYTSILIEELIKILKDQELQKLDFTKREDRYYFGRTLSMIGELSKDIKFFYNSEKKEGAGLFSFFKKIRDKKLAHFHYALVKDISKEQLHQFNLMLTILNKFESVIENLETNGLGETTESERQELNKLIDSIFGKNVINVDEKILEGIGSKKHEPKNIKIYFSNKHEKAVLKKRNLIDTLEQINRKVSLLDGQPFISQKKATKGLILIKKPAQKQSDILQQEIERLITCYNEVDLCENLKLLSNEIPSKERLLLLKSEIEQLDLQFLELEIKKEKKIPVINTIKPDSLPTEPNFDLEKTRESLRKDLSIIAKEFQYMIEVLGNDKIDDSKKQHVIDFTMTKIGQIFIDSEKKRNQLLSVFPKEHTKSIKEITKTRHKLMHEIYASNSIDRQHILFRHALPVLPEIESLKKIASLKMNDDHALLTLGRAYTEMKCYDKAIECFDQMLQLSGSYFLSITNIVSKEDVKHFGQASNALFGIAEAYGRAGDEAMAAEANVEAKQYYELKVRSIQQHLELLKRVDNVETPTVMADLIASTHNNLGNVYSYLGDYDKALNCFKKSLRILKNQKSYDNKREAIYLFNIGRIYFRKGFDAMEGFIGTHTFSTEATRHLSLALASLWEAKEIYENLQSFSKTDSFFLNLQICLIETLFFTSKEYFPYAIKMYNEFKQDLESFPIRETDQRLKYVECVNEVKQIAEKMKSNQPEKKLVEEEFKVIILNNLKVIYLELGLDDSILNEKMNQLINNTPVLNNNFIQEQKFHDLNNKACSLFRAGKSKQALPLFLEALEFLKTNVSDLMAETYGDLLESIGDTYINLNDPQNALKFLNASLNAHLKYQPNDRAFKIPRKCLQEFDKIHKNRSFEKNQLFFIEMMEKFKEKVGENDPRMNTLKLTYEQISESDEESVLRKYVSTINNASKFLLIPKQEVNQQALQEHCQKFMDAKCTEEKGFYKIYLNKKGKEYVNQLKVKNEFQKK